MTRRPSLAVVHAFHDGITSLYTGVGRVAQNICWTFEEVRATALAGLDPSLHFVTVSYPGGSPGFRADVRARSFEVVNRVGGTISEVSTPSSAWTANEVWGGPERWWEAGREAAKRVLAIAANHDHTWVFAHDIVFASLLPALMEAGSSADISAVWVPHSTARIHRYGLDDEGRDSIECATALAIRSNSWMFAGAVGRFMLHHLEEQYRVPRGRAILLRNGVVRGAPAYPRMSQARSTEILLEAGVPIRTPLVLFFGRCVPHKGVDLVLDAFAQQGSPAHLLLIAPPETGSAPYLAEVKRKLAALGDRATGVFRFDPQLPFAALSSDRTVAVTFPSRADPCPLGLMEAKLYAEGSAFVIIASDVDGLAEQAVEGGTKLVRPDVSELAVAIEQAAATPEGIRRQMALLAHQSLTDWDFARNHAAGLIVLRERLLSAQVLTAPQ